MSTIEPLGYPPAKNVTYRQIFIFGSIWLAIIIGSIVLIQWWESEDLRYATIDELLLALEESDSTVRRDVFYKRPFSLVADGVPANDKVTSILLSVMANDPDEEVALLAVNNLNMLEDPPIAAIIEMITADDVEMRARAEDALLVMAAEHDQVIENLIALVKSGVINDSIVKVLYVRGETVGAIPAVLDFIKDRAVMGKESIDAANALLFHAGEAARPAFEELVTHDLPFLRALGERGLRRLADKID